MGCTCQNSLQYTPTNPQPGFSRLMMDRLWNRTLHSDKSCKPLCLMTLKRRPRSVHPSDRLRSSPSIGGSHPHQAMRGVTCPLPILNSLSIFFYKWPDGLAPFVSLLRSTTILPLSSGLNLPADPELLALSLCVVLLVMVTLLLINQNRPFHVAAEKFDPNHNCVSVRGGLGVVCSLTGAYFTNDSLVLVWEM